MEDGGVPMLLTEKSETLKRSITASKLAVLRFFLVWTTRDYQIGVLGAF